MNEESRSYDELLAVAESLWREGRLQESADAYIHAAQSATAPQEQARAYAEAGTIFFLAKNKENQVTAKLKSAHLWLKAAEDSSKSEAKAEFYWQAFSQFVAIRDVDSQLDCIAKLIDVVRHNHPLITQWKILENLYKRFPDAGGFKSRRALQRILATIQVEQSHFEMNSEPKTKLLKSALNLYQEADDSEKYQTALLILEQEYCKRGAEVEREVGDYKGYEDRARTYEAAANAYSGYCEPERNRCLNLAADLRRSAIRGAEGICNIHAKLAALEDAINAGEFKVQHLPRNDWSVGLSSSQDHLEVCSHTFGFSRHLEAHEQFFLSFAKHCGLDASDPVVEELLRKLMMAYGETSSFCPTPCATPAWFITTKFSKLALALLAGVLTGGISGLAAGGPNLRAILIGVVGAHAAIFSNLIAAYLLMHREEKNEFSKLIKRYIDEPAKLYMVVELKKRPQTIPELCAGSGYSESKARRVINALKSDGVVRQKQGISKPILWEVEHQ